MFGGGDQEIKEEGKEDKHSNKIKAAKRTTFSPIEENLISILQTATKKNVKDTGIQNVMLICSYLVHLI